MILGDGIRLRGPEKDDIPRFTEWLNDPEVRQGLLIYLPMANWQEEKWFESLSDRPLDEVPLTIEIETPGEGWVPIGNIGIMDIEWRHRSGEVGLFIGEKRFWGQGYGRRVMALFLDHAFDTLNLNRFFLRVYDNNERAKRSYLSVGFIEEGRLRAAIYQDGVYFDVVMMSVLKSEWQERRSR